MNTITATGRLVADPQPVKSVGSSQVLNFRVASDVGFGDRKTTLWLSCAVWGKRAESLSNVLAKGQFVCVSGELSQREYEKDGQSRTSLELRVAELDLGPKQGDAPSQTAAPASAPAPGAAITDDEIPF